jgi:hypothetical protein
MFDLLWDVIQHRQIIRAEENTQMARQEAGRVEDRLQQETQQLEAKIDGLALICEAMWELLSERTGVSKAELMQKIAEIDQRDGRSDGRIRPRLATCPDCLRPLQSGQTRCIYCGATSEA